jgi:gas vesicle protein
MARAYKAGTILTIVMGAGVGAVVALLFAPKSGKELRGDIAGGVSNEVKQLQSIGKNIKQSAQKTAALAQDHMQDAMEAGEEAYTEHRRRDRHSAPPMVMDPE